MAHEYLPAFDRDRAVVGQRLQLAIDQLFQLIGERHCAELFDLDDGAAATVDDLRGTIDGYLHLRTRLRIWFRSGVRFFSRNVLLVLHG